MYLRMYLSSGEELEIPLMVVTSYMTQNPKGTNAKRERDTRFMEHLQPTVQEQSPLFIVL